MKHWIADFLSRIHNMKYRRKINGVMIIVGLVPLAIVAFFMISGFRKILSERERESMEVSLKQVSDSIERQEDVYVNLLTYTVFDSELQDILDKPQKEKYDVYYDYTKTVDPVLNMPKFYHDGIDHLTIYSDNIQIAHDTTLAPLAEIEGKSWFRELKTAQSALWVWPDDSHEQLLAIRSFPGFHESEAYLGVYCNLQSFTDPLQYFEKEGAGIMMIDDGNHILFQNADFAQDMTYDELADEYMILTQKISSLPVSVCIYMEKKAIYQEFMVMLGWILLVVGFCLLAILLISRYMSRILVRRIEALTRSVDTVDPEYRTICLEDDSRDEIGILVRSFHRMLDEINTLIREVYEGKIRQQRQEMKALQAQINPHFLYNTLSVINWKALAAGQDDISHVTLALSDFYRTTLNKGKSLITVESELLNIRSYLDIQLVMHDDDFTVEYDVNESLYLYKMPKLVLQPLIENALEHGLNLKDEGEKKLSIRCYEEKNRLIWKITDTGVGMEPEVCQSLMSVNAKGYGVRNVNERLELLYGNSAQMLFASTPGKGTTVTVYIPKQLSESGKGIIDEMEN